MSTDGVAKAKTGRHPRYGMQVALSDRFLMVLLCLTNLVNYVDRGIVPGASGEFNHFIRFSREGVSESRVSTCFGALASIFIVGFSLGGVCVGHLAHSYPPFKMASLGLCAWCLAAILAGLARHMKSYTVLLIARGLSGLGEAGFVTIGGPFIQDASRGKNTGAWLGLYFAAIPTGTAIGYGYGAAVAKYFNWSLAFYLEAAVMAPLAVLFYLSKNDASSVVKSKQIITDDAAEDEHDEEKEEATPAADVEDTPTFFEELRACFRSRTFAFASLGYAGYAGSVIGFSTFGPSIAVGLGLFESVTSASVAFSGTLAFAGIIGTPVGGLVLDAWTRHRRCSSLEAALEVALFMVGAGFVLIAGAVFATDRYTFLLSLGLGCLPLFAATTAMNLTIFESVDRGNRAFGVAIGTLTMHALGDVPTPIIVGALKDRLAPACAPDGDGDLGLACPDQRPMLRLVCACCDLWLCWSLLGFGIALFLARRNKLPSGLIRLPSDDDDAPPIDDSPLLLPNDVSSPLNPLRRSTSSSSSTAHVTE